MAFSSARRLGARVVRAVLVGACVAACVAAAPRPTIALVPLDDRPVTLELPKMLAAIAGTDVVAPPRTTVGKYLVPGDPEAIVAWLRSDATKDAYAWVVSTDMIAYGGLIASRAPSTSEALALTRLRDLAAARALRPDADVALFGTVMRLAPTGVPKLGAAASFFLAGPNVDRVEEYARLPDPPNTPETIRKAAALRAQIGDADLDAYLWTRGRDRSVDSYAMQLVAEGNFGRIVLGQDDAGPQGLHLKDLAALRKDARNFRLGKRVSIESGADELGMTLTGAALARHAGWTPRVRVRYSRSDGASVEDPLEFAPIDATIASLIGADGAVRTEGADADVDLFVRVAQTSDADDARFLDAIADDVQRGRLAAVADLTFLQGQNAYTNRLVEGLIARGIAGKIAGFASWNTTANTIGTTLPEAIAVGVGLRRQTYDRGAHVRFLLDRYIDDYAFHAFVRPVLNDDLAALGITDHTFLLPAVARAAGNENDELLWPLALDLLHEIFPETGDCALTITLPWDRTFETQIDIRTRAGRDAPFTDCLPTRTP
jgi:hypothetical protein